MNLRNVTLTIDGVEVGVTNVEITMEAEGVSPSVEVQGYLTNKEATKKPERPHWWGCDMGKGDSQTFVTHHVVGPSGGDWFRERYLNGNWDYEEVTKKEPAMDRCEDKCAEDDGYYGGERLAQELKDLELNDDQRKLLKYGLIGRNGLITNKGKEVLLNHLLGVYTDEIVEELEALEESKKLKKANE